MGAVTFNPLFDLWRDIHGDKASYCQWNRQEVDYKPINRDDIPPGAVDENVMEELFDHPRSYRITRSDVDSRSRHAACQKYSWATPGPEAIAALVTLGPLVDVGAGTGYWARQITDAGGDVVAYDIDPPRPVLPIGKGAGVGVVVNHFHPNASTFFPVLKGDGPEVVVGHADRVLFLCWPQYAGCSTPGNPEELASMTDDDVGYRTILAYRESGGQTVAYVGEGGGGYTGGWTMHNELAEHWCEVETVEIPQWWGIHDTLTIYRAKESS